MTRPLEPGDFGFSAPRFFGFGLNVALDLASQVGLGLPLVNALRERFPEASSGLLGQLASTVGRGARAAAQVGESDPLGTVDPGILPTVPPQLFIRSALSERFTGRARVTFTDPSGAVSQHEVLFFTGEDQTIESIKSQIEDQFQISLADTDPELADQISIIEIIIYWLGRKF